MQTSPDEPQWRQCEIICGSLKSKSPLILFWRDGLEVVEHLFCNPALAQWIDFQPYRDYDEGQHGSERVYRDFMSGNNAWSIQDRLPQGHTFLGVIGASERMPSAMGRIGCDLHPVLLSIANIRAEVRMNPASRSFLPAAYIPIPVFLDASAEVRSLLTRRIYHYCLDIVMASLKRAEREAVRIRDPQGQFHLVHTPLVAWIADFPDQLTIAGITGVSDQQSCFPFSPGTGGVTHPPSGSFRTRQQTLEVIYAACSRTDPWHLDGFLATTRILGLNGVVQPFWRDWGTADPSLFLLHNSLRQWEELYHNSCLKWVVNVMGDAEFDRRLSILGPYVGIRQWPRG
ncbi:hypothetical protein BV25DRAFT_1765258, partial [Artomyces pyxidatus]